MVMGVDGMSDISPDWRVVGPGIWRREGTGPHLGVVGSIHGDEPAGAQVIRELLAGRHLIPQGPDVPTITLAIGNPEALELGSRATSATVDLNRLFGGAEAPDGAEARRVDELKGAFAGVDRLLDIHQTACETPPLAVAPNTEPHREATRGLGLGVLVAAADRLYGGGMLSEWVDREGGLGLAVETGRKGTPEALNVARQVTSRAAGGPAAAVRFCFLCWQHLEQAVKLGVPPQQAGS